MALGLLLGAASGAAIIVFFGTRLPRREIRVTVTRDVLPRRSETLSQDAFVTSPAEPAQGGPGDRRWNDREDGGTHPPDPRGDLRRCHGDPRRPRPDGRPNPSRDRTIVPTGPGRSVSGANPRTPPRPRIRPPCRSGARAAWRARSPPRRGLGRRPGGERDRSLGREPPHDRGGRRARAGAGEHRRAWGSALERMLRGEHRAMVEVLDQLPARTASSDGRGAPARRASSRPWPRSRSANR